MQVFPSMTVKTINNALTVLDSNSLHLSILQRRESQVEDIIEADQSAIHFRNAWGQSALHIAADWPCATALLLKKGADPYQVDNYGCTAIDYACYLESYEVVRTLLEAGSPLLSHTVLEEAVARCVNNNSRKLFELIIIHLATRRRELLQTARILLSEATLSSIVHAKETVPDSSSDQLIKAVCAAGHTTKPKYWLQNVWRLYRSRVMNPAAADVLYDAGFKHLEDQTDGRSSLVTNATSTAMTVWLYRKGVSFTEWTGWWCRRDVLLGITDWTCPYSAQSMPLIYGAISGSIHFMSICDKQFTSRPSRIKLSEDDIEAFNIFLQDKFSGLRDLCHCHCSAEGCSPEVMVLKSILTCLMKWAIMLEVYSKPALLPKFVRLVDKIIVELNNRLPESNLNRLGQAAIRMALFLDLGLRHLSCKMKDDRKITHPVGQEEANEIREEDKFLLERFEAILPKALSEWAESPKNFAGFWRDFHRVNICRQRNSHLDGSEMDRLRELGVVVHEEGEQEKDCGFFYGDGEGYCVSLCSDGQEEGEGENEDEDERCGACAV